MELISLKLLPLTLTLKQPFTSNHDQLRQRQLTLVQLIDDAHNQAIGEFEAFDTPTYTAETQPTGRLLLAQQLGPFLKNKKFADPAAFNRLFANIVGQPMALAALEMPVWQLFANRLQLSLADYLAQHAKTQVRSVLPVGISLGVMPWPDLKQQALQAVAQGYQRLKVKVARPADFTKIVALRQLLPQMPLMVDGNSAFGPKDLAALKALDPLNLAMIEQPFATTDFVDHAWLQQRLTTPICLDEPIFTLSDVQTAAHLKSASVINLKPARVGGFTKALAILQYCQQQHLTCWIGGMVESDLGRYYSQNLARLAPFVFPGDVGPATQFFKESLCLQHPQLIQGALDFTAMPRSYRQGPILKPEFQAAFKQQPNLLS
ncbi:o-succinylbenzoate synthase [Agrilactobacillus yilanensis]|uniref:o-succinylbenzoate synthase n=1 Tax=Agrilactobacillus yilanensis TaxID=2485997 RepID=A0ABW4JB78_9LACO|nr:o-succinylbenzoate synthase [Agrilactobacillus yilanensis]